MVCPVKGSTRFPVGYAECIGRRPTMEDQIVILGMGPRIREPEDYFAIFDGHGGSYVAEHCARHFHKRFRSALSNNPDIKEAIQVAFARIDSEFIDQRICGATALIAFISQSTLYIANIGDSRAILGTKSNEAIRLSLDHKPNLQSEHDRITSLGGTVSKINGTWRINSLLAVSRAFGDFLLKPVISSVPYISETPLQEEYEFLVLACDGVWDVLSDQQVVDIVCQNRGCAPQEVAEILRRIAFTRGSDDNISVLVVFLQDK